MKNIFFLILLSFSFNSLAAKLSVRKLKESVNKQSLKLSKLAANIRSLDKRISRTNDEYLEKIKKIESYEAQSLKLQSSLSKSAKSISKEYKLVKKAFDLYLLEVSARSGNEKFANPKLYLQILTQKIKDLNSAQTKSKNLLKSLQGSDLELSESKRTEQELYQVIYELENSKKELGTNYISLLEQNNRDQEVLDNALAKQSAKRKIYKKTSNFSSLNISFSMPITNFLNAKKGKKGVSFQYDEILPLKAPASGTVSYAGDLASYGKIIMIKHSKNIRSVFLGDISLKVEKGNVLEKGQVVGYTIADPGVKKTLYYEIRKKNIAQDTYRLLAQNNKNLKI